MRARARPRRKGEEAQRRPAISASGSLKRTCVHASSSGTSSTGSVSPCTQCRCPRASMLPFHATQIRRARRSTAVKARSITLADTPASRTPRVGASSLAAGAYTAHLLGSAPPSLLLAVDDRRCAAGPRLITTRRGGNPTPPPLAHSPRNRPCGGRAWLRPPLAPPSLYLSKL